MADLPYQSLYRRYRPQRFDEVRGQDHVTMALRNAVANGRTTHAYLFSGPRGTGKTSTARILAAALNCAAPVDGEPCGVCESCIAVRTGASFDVVEVDAASNNKIDEMRTLLERVALGSPGRWKVYIIDEVHMLSTGSSNALLKTLEEPPGHVIFVLATTDPQKVLPTIRSRTQHYEFRLLGPELLGSLMADVNERAGLGLDPGTLDRVVRRGNGSARDALSALDQAAAAGGAEDEIESIPAIVDALAAKDAAAALVAVADATGRGRDPQRLAVETVEHLRTAFLLTMAPELAGVPADQRAQLEERGRRLGPAATVRAMEVLGETLVAMRDALDTRVTFELALVRLCAPKADASPEAIVERLEALERQASGAEPARPAPASAAPAPPAPRAASPEAPAGRDAGPPPLSTRPASPQPAPPGRGPTGPRPTIGAMRQRGNNQPQPAPAPPPAPEHGTPAATRPAPTRDELTKAWGDTVLPGLANGIRSIYRQGRWTAVDDGVATFVLPNEVYRDRARDRKADVERALGSHFGSHLTVRLDVERDGGAPSPGSTAGPGSPEARVEVEEEVSVQEFAQLEPAPDAPSSAEARLLEVFPGSEEITG